MARQRLRGNTLSGAFPLLSSYSGQTVVIPSGDEQPGVPGLLFIENIMPMANGIQSVGYQLRVNPGLALDFDQAFYLRDREEFKTLYVPANGKNYLYDYLNNRWISQPSEIAQRDALVSVVNIKGRQFVFYAHSKTFLEWDGVQLLPVGFNGLNPSAILGLVAANSYQIAYDEKAVYWSGVLFPTDFVPSLASGAGGSEIMALRGNIVVCTPISDGFLIYTTSNIISATFSGNIRFPWVFKELGGSAGISSYRQVTHEDATFPQYAFTVSGMMAVLPQQAQQIWPEVSEFISERRYEYYDYTKKEIIEVDLNDALQTKITSVAERYIVLSYGDNTLTHALVFDIGLKRWGKLKIDHVDCFTFIDQRTATFPGPGKRYKDLIGSYALQTSTYFGYGHLTIQMPARVRYIQLYGSYADQGKKRYMDYDGLDFSNMFINTGEEPYKGIGFLKATGEVVVVNFDLPIESENSVAYIGKYQLSRNRLTDLYEVWIENMSSLPNTKLAIIPSLDGANFDKAIYPMKDKNVSKGKLQKYLCNQTATSLTLRFEGSFDPHSIEFVFGVAGYR